MACHGEGNHNVHSPSMYSMTCGMTCCMSGRRKFKETVGMSFTVGNIPQNVMCPLQGIAI